MENKEISALVIDDSLGMRKLVRIICNSLGILNLREAKDGKEALQILSEETSHFDLVLCDHTMPEISGAQLLKLVRQSPRLKDLLFFVVTAETDPGLIDEIRAAGATDILHKPFTASALKEILAKHHRNGRKNWLGR